MSRHRERRFDQVTATPQELPKGRPAELERSLRKLKPGPGLPAEVVAADQRRRLRHAVIDLAVGQGFDKVTVRALSRRAGVSTRTFYLHFENVADCFGFACESALLSTLARVDAAKASAADPNEALRSAVDAVMTDVVAHPDAAAALLLEMYAAEPAVRTRVDATVETFGQALGDLLASIGVDPVSARLLGGTVAGVTRVMRITTLASCPGELSNMTVALTRWILAVATAPSPTAPSRARDRVRRRREPDPFPDGAALGAARSMGDERERILRATARLSAEVGFEALTVTEIRKVAGVSRRRFDALFSGLDECFLASIDWIVSTVTERGRSWAALRADPRRMTSRLIVALTAQAARNECLADVVFRGVLEAGPKGLCRRDHLVATAARGIRAGAPRDPIADWATEASVAAAWHIAAAEVAAGRARSLPRLSPVLAHLVLGSASPVASRA